MSKRKGSAQEELMIRQLKWEKDLLKKKLALARLGEEDSDTEDDSSDSDDITSGTFPGKLPVRVQT